MRERTRKRNKKRIFGFIICLIALGIGVTALVLREKKDKEEQEAESIYDELRVKAVTEVADGELLINWDLLSGYEVVGWIKMGEYIDYPIVQNKESNKYYLKKAYDGSYCSHGSIFMEKTNNADFMDLNTVIYGHNMHSGSTVAFGSLMDLLEEADGEPKSFDIYRPDGTKHTYEIYSINRVKATGDAYKTEFGSAESYLSYKDEMMGSSERDFGVKRTGTRTVLLSTCDDYGSSAGNRVVVLGQESGVKQVQDAASWYVKKNYIEISNKNAVSLKGNNYYYIVQDDLALRCREEDIGNFISDSEETVIVRVQYEETGEAYQYTDLSGESYVYPIIEAMEYKTE